MSSRHTTPYFSIEASECDAAIRATITIDHLTNSTFGICKRTDSRRLVEFTTKQKRMYCTPDCAHLANLRKQSAETVKPGTVAKEISTLKYCLRLAVEWVCFIQCCLRRAAPETLRGSYPLCHTRRAKGGSAIGS